jgi:hypothetical protein
MGGGDKMEGKTLFDRLYAVTEEAAKVLKKPFVKNKVGRALDGAADSYESQKIDKLEEIDKLMTKLANGDTGAIENLIEARMVLAEIEAQAVEAGKIKTELFDKSE